MTPPIYPVTHAIEKAMAKSFVDELTQTSSLSDTESDTDASASTHVAHGVNIESNIQHPRRKTVTFSQVLTRIYNVIDELPSPQDDEDQVPRRTLGWDYTERQLDIENHLLESIIARQRLSSIILHERILFQEKVRESTEKDLKPKRKGWRASLKRALKPVGRGYIEAATKSNIAFPGMPYY